MIGTVLGFRRMSFHTDDGADISGYRVYCSYADENVQGIATDSFFLRDRQGGYVPVLDDIVMVDRNQHGRVTSCQSLNAVLDRYVK